MAIICTLTVYCAFCLCCSCSYSIYLNIFNPSLPIYMYITALHCFLHLWLDVKLHFVASVLNESCLISCVVWLWTYISGSSRSQPCLARLLHNKTLHRPTCRSWKKPHRLHKQSAALVWCVKYSGVSFSSRETRAPPGPQQQKRKKKTGCSSNNRHPSVCVRGSVVHRSAFIIHGWSYGWAWTYSFITVELCAW